VTTAEAMATTDRKGSASSAIVGLVDCISLLLKTPGDETGYFLFVLYDKEAHIS